MEKYNGDIILIERLAEFTFQMQWNDNGRMITLDDISCGIHEALPEQPDEYGNNTDRPAFEKSDDWHIGRIIYFINHPDEIRNIEIDNYCDNGNILPFPVIVDGNHRFMAAAWLNDRGKMYKIHCMYGGRRDVLDYLTGESNICPD